jgi:nucleoside-diphosphate kinase
MRGFALIKPEAIQRNLVGRILSSLEDKGFKILALKMLQASKQQIQNMYGHLEHLPYFNKIIECSTDGPVIAMVLELPGDIDPNLILTKCQGTFETPGTLRYDFVTHPSRNVLHCSDDYLHAEKELNLFFLEEEICQYNKVLDDWLIEKS